MMRKTKNATLCLLFAFLFVCAAVLPCCGASAPAVEDLRADVASLLAAAPKINEVFFGVGLPVFDRADPANEALYYEVPESMAIYDVVDISKSDYDSVSDIREAALRVYSEACMAPIFSSAFDGVSSNLLPDTTLIKSPVFIEQDGFFYQLRRSEYDLNYNSIADRQLSFDLSTLRVTKPSSQSSVSLSVSATNLLTPSASPIILTFRILSTPSGWRLDTLVV